MRKLMLIYFIELIQRGGESLGCKNYRKDQGYLYTEAL